MERHDYSIEEARNTMETLTADCDESVLIVAEYPEIDYVLAYRGGSYQPWVAAWGYNGTNSWAQGHYFETLTDAMKYIRIRQKNGKPNWYRMDEIATKTIDKLIEEDPYEAEEFLKEELELTDEEVEYFGIGETLDMVKRYEEEDE